MSLKLVNLPRKYPDSSTIDYNLRLYTSSHLWGKACTAPNGDIAMMQGLVTCKDYVVDTYYRPETHQYKLTTYGDVQWTQEQIKEPCFVVCPTATTHAQRLLKNLTNFLHQYEESNGIEIKTTIEKCKHTYDTKRDIYVVRFDPIWMINATAISTYMSIIRMMCYQHDITTIDFNCGSCNEGSWYINLGQRDNGERLQEVFKYYYNNPKELFVDFSDPYYKDKFDATGYPKGAPVGHGQTGLYYIMTNIASHFINNSNGYKSILHSFFFGKMLYKKYHGYVYPRRSAAHVKIYNKYWGIIETPKKPRTRRVTVVRNAPEVTPTITARERNDLFTAFLYTGNNFTLGAR